MFVTRSRSGDKPIFLRKNLIAEWYVKKKYSIDDDDTTRLKKKPHPILSWCIKKKEFEIFFCQSQKKDFWIFFHSTPIQDLYLKRFGS